MGIKYTTNYKTMQLSTSEIEVDETYQRDFRPAIVKKILDKWNDCLVNPPKVSKRDGKYFVFDGQHTIAAIKKRNGGNNQIIECRVYEGLTQKDEADLFVAQFGENAALRKNEAFRAKFNTGDDEIVRMVKLAEKHGCLIDFKESKKDHYCTAVAKLYSIYKDSTTAQFEEILNIIEEAWDGNKDGYRACIMDGIATFVKKYWNEYDRKALISRLQKIDPMFLIKETYLAKQKTGKVMARAILNVYNNKARGNRLEDKF